jgi:predicted alpha/beta-fold hydrolase
MSYDFQPLPFLRNPHLQTVLGNYLAGPELRHPTREHQVLLPDGDRLVLYDNVPTGWQTGGRIALLVHGLGGSHQSHHLQRLARRLLRHGLRVVRMDLRGAARGLPLARRAYHGGCSADVRAAVLEILRGSPSSPLVLIGSSLGGNIVLKLAGEVDEHPVPGLEGVAALAPPIDLERSVALLGLPSNRLYERYFLRDLLRDARRRQSYFPSEPAARFPRRMSIRRFDDLYTAPRWGFVDALDYYHRCSALPLLSRISVPTLILAARDDPFVSVEPFEQVTAVPQLDLRIVKHGGHLGFVGWDGAGGFHWAEQRIVEWVHRHPNSHSMKR